MEKRKLASIQYVHHIEEIEGADRIELVKVLGWQCVANKGQFKVGDRCIYFEVDSFLPMVVPFEFLRASSYKKNELMGEGYRLKTMKFKGQISQGLVQPLSIIPEGNYEIGDDLTDILGVRKWEIEERVTSSGKQIGNFPDFISKTDELRVQSYPGLIEEFKVAGRYYISTKMDGTSVTMYRHNGKFGVCGRNYEYADDDSCAMWRYAHEHRIAERMEELGYDDIALQGEYCGAGIQKNRLKLVRPEWYVFTAVDITNRKRLGLDKMRALCEALGLNMVPVEEIEDEFKYETVEELIERAKGKYTSGANKEGIVIRPVEPVYSPRLQGNLSMKVINNDYLLKE